MSDLVATAVGVAVLVGAIAGWIKWARPKWHSAKHDITAGRDALVGREAVIDSMTGKTLAPALPGIGQRMGLAEENINSLSNAMVALADTHQRLDSHDLRLSRLETGASERTLARTESIELLRTIDTAIKADNREE